ncbi:MAG: alpha-amylase family glycosyl hydrolase [Candidatus Enteromonas sp.]|nr:alpha-amylase family glycosyl hydrolase [Candidatus Enteromonas sp.]
MNTKTRKNVLAGLILGGLLSSCGSPSGYRIENVSNAEGSVGYEVFVGSFCDSNGDGIGDLKGIENKLGYLQRLGIKYLWLTPIHPSDSYHKYDVKDYYAIDPSFGTMEDFESLVAKANEKGISILLDMVFNHTSRKGTWFRSWADAVNKGDQQSEFYHDFVPIRNGEGKAGYSSFPEVGGMYLESNFSSDMPEFNMDSPHVRDEFKKIQRFWLSKGVGGFRYDAVKYYYCTNSNGNITGDAEKNVALMKELADDAKSVKSDVYLVAECWVDDPSLLATYCKSGMNLFHFPTSELNFSGSMGFYLTINGADAFSSAVESANAAYKEAREDSDFVYFISNHDQDRWGSFGNGKSKAAERRKAMVSAYLLTPGTPFMYYGEEIEMVGRRGENEKTDAARRQAMVWGGNEPMCAQPEGVVFPGQVTKGVKEAEADGYSMLQHYRKVISIRNKYGKMFRYGTFSAIPYESKRCAGFRIDYEGETYYLIHNANGNDAKLSVPGASKIVETIPTSKTDPSFDGETLSLPFYSSVLMK